MKFSKKAKANILKRVQDFSGDAAKAVEEYIKKDLDVDELSDEWVRKNVDRIRVKQDGATVDIENKTFRNMASRLNPFRTGVKLDADLDSGQVRGLKQDKRIITKFEKDPSKAPDAKDWKSNVKKILGIAGAGGAAGAGATAYAQSGSDSGKKSNNKELKRRYLNYVRQKRQGI